MELFNNSEENKEIVINGERYSNYNSEYMYKRIELSLGIKDFDESRKEMLWSCRQKQLKVEGVSELDMVRV